MLFKYSGFIIQEYFTSSGKPSVSQSNFITEQQGMICEQHIFLSIKGAQMEVFTSS